MTWQQWVLIALYSFSALWGVLMIGKEREPYTPTTAAIGIVVSAGFAWLVVSI